MGRLEDLRINAYLSEVARGYSNNAFVAQYLFPTIYSEKEEVKIFEFNKEAFKIYDTGRAIRANSNVISPKGFKKHSAILEEHDLSYPIDYREEQESERVKLEIHATNVVTEGLRLEFEKTCADMVQNPNNFPKGSKITLSGTSCFSETGSDPIGVVDDAKNSVSLKIGRDPNTMIIGQDAWQTLKKHPKITELLSHDKTKLVTLEILKQIFEVENIYIGKAIYADNKDNFSRIWKDNIVMAFVPNLGPTRTEYDPTFAYNIQKKDALNIDEYTKEGNKVKYIRATDIYTPFIVGADAGYLISGVNAKKKEG